MLGLTGCRRASAICLPAREIVGAGGSRGVQEGLCHLSVHLHWQVVGAGVGLAGLK